MASLSAPLRALLIAQAPADFADWLDFIAIGALLAFVWQAPPIAFALLAVAIGLPALVVGPLIAGWIDSADLRRVMIWANLGRALTTFALITAPGWPVLLALVVLRTSVDAAFTPAKQAALQAVAGDELTRANQMSTAINQTSKVLAPTLGGALLAVIAPSQLFVLNGTLSLVAAALLLRFPANLREPAEAEPIWQGLRASWALVRGTAALRFAVLAMGLVLFANFLFDTLIPPHLSALGLDQTDLGLSIAAVGVGTILGALAPMAPGRLTLWIALGAGFGGSLTIALGVIEIAALPVARWQVIAVFFGLGLASGRVFVPLRVMVQENTPPAQMARVAALSEAVNTLALLTAPFIGAAIAAGASTGWSFVAGGAVFLALGAGVPWLRRR